MKLISGPQFSPPISQGWESLSIWATSILHSFEWVSAIPAFYSKEEKLHWIYLEDDRGPAAAIVLSPRHQKLRGIVPVRILASFNPRGILHADAIVRSDADMDQLVERIFEARLDDGARWDVVRMEYLREESSLMRLFSKLPHSQIEEFGKGVAMLSTTGEVEAWRSRLSTSFLADLRKSRSRLGRSGEVSVKMFSGSAADVLAGFSSFVELESSGWKGGSGALANDPPDHGVFRAALENLAPAGCSGVMGLYLDSRMVAGYIWVRVKTTLFALKTAYAEDLARMAPGKVLTEQLIEFCFAQPSIERIDFCALAEWHLKFGVSVEKTYAVKAYNPRTILGKLGIMRSRRQRLKVPNRA